MKARFWLELTGDAVPVMPEAPIHGLNLGEPCGENLAPLVGLISGEQGGAIAPSAESTAGAEAIRSTRTSKALL